MELAQVLQELVDVDQLMTANLNSGEGALIAHAAYHLWTLFDQASQTGELFPSTERRNHKVGITSAHRAALASLRASLAIAANLTKSHNV